MDVVGEKALGIEDGAQALSAGLDRHGLAVLVAVHFDDGVKTFLEGVTVGGKADHRQNNAGGGIVGSDAKDLGGMAGVDVVA